MPQPSEQFQTVSQPSSSPSLPNIRSSGGQVVGKGVGEKKHLYRFVAFAETYVTKRVPSRTQFITGARTPIESLFEISTSDISSF